MINKHIKQKHIIRIPNDITIIHCNKKKIITFIGPSRQKSLKLDVIILILKVVRILKVSLIPFSSISNHRKKKLKSTQGTTVALIKQILTEVSVLLYKKLKFIGVGYRAFEIEDCDGRLFMLRLGYSHSVYFRTPDKLKISCLKLIKFFVCGDNYQRITQVSSLIRSFKSPEPYKGKGILYEDEKIVLKQGKKI